MIPLIQLRGMQNQIIHFAWKNIKIRYRGTNLGLVWMAFEPLLFWVFLYLVFTSINIGAREDFGIYLITGLVIYHNFVRGSQGGLMSLRENFGILSSMNVKREFFPVVATTTSSIVLMVELVVFFGIMGIFQFVPAWTIILLPIVLILLQILILGISYLLSITYAYFRDIQPLWGIFVTALMFVTPIFWYLEDAGGFALEIQKINPLGQLIELTHQIVFGNVPSIQEWLYPSAMIFGILFAAFVIFKKFERHVVEKI